jgi:hypothetical protein
VDKVEFTGWELLVQMAVALQGCLAITAKFNDRNPVKPALIVLSMGFQGFNDQPLVRISLANFVPTHGRIPLY